MHGKIKPKGVVAHAIGPTFTENDPAKFKGDGKRSGKTMSNGVVSEAKGPTITENSTHIPTMNADIPAKGKSRKDGKWFDPHETNKPRSAEDAPVKLDATYKLKMSYSK